MQYIFYSRVIEGMSFVSNNYTIINQLTTNNINNNVCRGIWMILVIRLNEKRIKSILLWENIVSSEASLLARGLVFRFVDAIYRSHWAWRTDKCKRRLTIDRSISNIFIIVVILIAAKEKPSYTSKNDKECIRGGVHTHKRVRGKFILNKRQKNQWIIRIILRIHTRIVAFHSMK